jgi:hypothetical protein
MPVPVPGFAPKLTLTCPFVGQIQLGAGCDGIEGNGFDSRFAVEPLEGVERLREAAGPVSFST